MGKLESFPISPGSQSHVPNFGSGGTEPDRFFAGDQFEFTNGPGAANGWPPPRSQKNLLLSWTTSFRWYPNPNSIFSNEEVF